MPSATFNQYSTAQPLLGPLPQWVGMEDQLRIASYQLYEEMYWNIPGAFELSQRGSDASPVYVPAPMGIVETRQRYLANDLDILTDPDYGTPEQRAEAQRLINETVARERFYSKFATNKRFGIIRGDWLWHLYADPERAEGSRISILPVDPAAYFPIYRDDNIDEVIGCFLVEHIRDADDKDTYIKRTKYEKESGTGGPSRILVSEQIFALDKWGGPGLEEGLEERIDSRFPEFVRRVEDPLPEQITSLPVYHVQNFQEPGSVFGSSELRGLERICAAINQTISDEELTLAMQGIGVYVTDAGAPIDEDGNEVGWNLGPAQVVEVPHGKKFERANGVGSVQPFLDHVNYLHSQIDHAKGMSDAVKGHVDVRAAESGISLRLQMEPFLSRIREGDQVITDVHLNMLYDLRAWFAAYEGLGGLEEVAWVPIFGEKIPQDRKAKFREVLDLVKEGIIDSATGREMLEDLGYEFPADIEARIAAEDQRRLDLFGSRVDAEIESGDGADEGEAERDE
jgi:hypothetical protein